ncbi:hypothetical protein ACFL0W_03250 [Nanoarchaeota archaeon]
MDTSNLEENILNISTFKDIRTRDPDKSAEYLLIISPSYDCFLKGSVTSENPAFVYRFSLPPVNTNTENNFKYAVYPNFEEFTDRNLFQRKLFTEKETNYLLKYQGVFFAQVANFSPKMEKANLVSLFDKIINAFNEECHLKIKYPGKLCGKFKVEYV